MLIYMFICHCHRDANIIGMSAQVIPINNDVLSHSYHDRVTNTFIVHSASILLVTNSFDLHSRKAKIIQRHSLPLPKQTNTELRGCIFKWADNSSIVRGWRFVIH